ncbi:MAG: sugar phosphate nucleotidyltransferase [Candidatus Gastranaerophilales bacterium]|nr:sugar phosphate nucleotidyltransferase [Candidatus Gastranaerophilales bacterium]
MIKKEMIAMLLAGEQGNGLGVLTSRMAKSAVPFGGKYRIIDFPLSNCIHSGVDTVGVLTQYRPLRLNAHIGIGIPWDLDRNVGGITVLPPCERADSGEWQAGMANDVYHNLEYIESYDPDYVLILSGAHIYKMDYEAMLNFHKANGADVTVAVMAGSEGTDRLAGIGIYIFDRKVLEDVLAALADQPMLDFDRHVIPYCREKGFSLCAYEFNGYWRDVSTLYSYWKANMELVDIVPEFNLYEEYWKIYTKSESCPPQYLASQSVAERSIIGEGSEIYGKVYNSVIGRGVMIGEDTVVRDSIIMNQTQIGAGCELDKAIVAENVKMGGNVKLGIGEEIDNNTAPHIYNHGIVTIGERSVIPDGVIVGRNAVIFGETVITDYEAAHLAGGKTLIKAGEQR